MAEDDLALILDIGFILSKELPILVNDRAAIKSLSPNKALSSPYSSALVIRRLRLLIHV